MPSLTPQTPPGGQGRHPPSQHRLPVSQSVSPVPVIEHADDRPVQP
jgi:hypothetical protein